MRNLKYDETGYFWADTYDGVNVAYLGKEDVEGKSRWDSKDVNGKLFIQEIINNGRNEGGGYTEYYFVKPNETTPLPKRSYSIAYEPFQWVIGTGNYTDDIDKVIIEKTKATHAHTTGILIPLMVIGALTLVTSLIVSVIAGRRISKPITVASEYISRLSDGDLSQSIKDEQKYMKMKDETGNLIRSLSKMRQNLIGMLQAIFVQSNIANDAAKISREDVAYLHSQTAEVADVTMDMSAGMEQTAASTQEINATTTEIETNSKTS